MIAGITEWILALHGIVALLIIFLLPALEASAFLGFLFPGEIAILLGGVLAYEGRISLPAAIAAAVLGAFIGDTVGFFVGRRWGRTILRWIIGHMPLLKHRVEDHLDRAEKFLQRRGPHAVVIGRFTAALRVMVPGLAGMSGMPYRRFALFNAIGALLWGSGFVLLGYSAGAAWPHIAGIASKVGLGLLVSILIALIAARAIRRHRDAGVALSDRMAAARPVAALRRTFPTLSAHLADRVDTTSPRGFLLTLTALVAGICGWLFLGLRQDVLAHEEAVHLDHGITSYALAHRDAVLTAAMRTFTWLGSNAVLIPVALAVAAVMLRKRLSLLRSAAPLISLVSAIAFYTLVKASVARPRPPVSIHLVDASGFAFPSGHAAASAATWGAVAVVLATGRSRRTKIAVWSTAGVIVGVVGLSRIYLGVHWFTDVVAGWALGGVCLCVVVAVQLSVPTARSEERLAR